MAVDRTYHCDGPDCETHATTAASRLPVTFLKVTQDGDAKHFCSWDCVLRFAATVEPMIVIEAGE